MVSPFLYKYADHVDSTGWPLLRVWPAGIAFLLVSPWLFGIGVRALAGALRRRAWSYGSASLAILPLGLASGLVFVGVPAFTRVPSPPSQGSTHIKILGDVQEPPMFTVYFENGSAELGRAQRAKAAAFALAAEKCGIKELTVTGFASSAEYRMESDLQNMKLANDRAEALRRILQRPSLKVETTTWTDFTVMTTSRLFHDVDGESRRLNAVEFLNRRAEAKLMEALPCRNP